MEDHGAQVVPGAYSPDGQLGMHIDENVLSNARTSSTWRRKLARALLHETWHLWYAETALGEHPGGYYTNAFGEVVYRDQPYSEVNECLK